MAKKTAHTHTQTQKKNSGVPSSFPCNNFKSWKTIYRETKVTSQITMNTFVALFINNTYINIMDKQMPYDAYWNVCYISLHFNLTALNVGPNRMRYNVFVIA